MSAINRKSIILLVFSTAECRKKGIVNAMSRGRVMLFQMAKRIINPSHFTLHG
jgi:hypothetical protein